VALALVIIVINDVILRRSASASAATEVPSWLLRLRATQVLLLLQPLLLLRPKCRGSCPTAVGAAGRSAT
jgi:hypothetical protein